MKPDEIEKLSFSIIDGLIPEPRIFTGACWNVARRIIHTTGDIDILPNMVLSQEAINYGIKAIRAGATIYTDTQMAVQGIAKRHIMPFGGRVECLLSQNCVDEMAKKEGITRSKAAILLAKNKMENSILAIGNAPTALLALLDVLAAGAKAPALIIGMPVGFVNAVESKDLLCKSKFTHLSIKGRKGGSALAAATVNAIAIMAGQNEAYTCS